MSTTVDEYGNIVDEYDYAQANIPDYITNLDPDSTVELSDGTSLSIADIYSDPSRALDAIKTPADANTWLSGIEKVLGKTISDGIKSLILKDGKLNTSGLATAGVALYGLMGGNEKKYDTAGYTKAVPTLTATRAQVPYAADPNRRPGEGGRQYFTDVQYAAPADTAAAQTAATTEAQGIASRYVPKAATTPTANIIPISWNPVVPAEGSKTPTENQTVPASGVASLLPVPAAGQQQYTKPIEKADGGSIGYAHGGIASGSNGQYLAGKTDGMADELSTSIDGEQPAALSHGEFVIPADVVSHLGNGNSEAGAEKLYTMMDRIRKARTGTTEQGKKINPENFMPGGKVGYADGGAVGGGLSSSLSPWAGEYVTGMLGKTQALANAKQQVYGGPLTADASDLQKKSFAGIGALAGAGYTPQTYAGGTFGAAEAQKYMNPYLSAALNPQLDEMRRQSEISRVADAGRMAKAGAYGGGRQAIMESEGGRNLLEAQTKAIGTGYQTAYDKAMGQFNTEQERRLGAEKDTEASRRYGAEYGLKSLGEMSRLGETQRDIEAEGIAAEKKQFEEQRDYPAAMLKFQREQLTGLPIETQKVTSQGTTGVNQLAGSVSGAQSVIDALKKLGVPL